MDTDSSQVQLINCTAAYNGINQNDNAGFENDQWNGPGDGQVYILNCIGSHTGGENGDFDRRGGFRPTYSLARDATGPWGLGNQWGEPFYRSSVTDLPFPISNQLLGTLFQLRPGSAAVDAGHPAAKWNDTDGTRNDMGAFGGPDAGVIGTLESGLEIPFVHVATFPSPNLPSGSVLLEDTDTIWLGFTVPVSATLLSQIQIRNDGVDVPGTMSLVGGGHLVQFVPDTVLTPGASDFVEVTIGAGLRSAAGALINRGSSFRFAVQPSTPIAEGVNDDTVAGLTAADLAAAQVIGNGAAPAVFDVNGTLDVTTDDDVYAITVEAGDRLMATTIDDRNGGGTNGQIHLNLYDANFGLITEGRRGIFRENNAGDTYVDHTFETAGTYYLVVNNRSLGAALPYILRAVLDN